MDSINIIFPNQLFKDSPFLESNLKSFMIEEFLFFGHYKFHKQKLLFHRISMKKYQDYLIKNGINTHYVNAVDENSKIEIFINNLDKKYTKINIIDPCDYWLEKKIKSACLKKEIKLNILSNQSFLLEKHELNSFFKKEKKKFFQTSFYKDQRKKFNILIKGDDKPEGGEWTYDIYNREKYPVNKIPPKIYFQKKDKYFYEAIDYINKYFGKNYGSLVEDFIYPTCFEESKKWFEKFLKDRFQEFGPYEDAVVKNNSILNHSVLSPLLNSGILNVKYVINTTIDFYNKNNIPINSCEGFIRQIIGWREFIRGVYYSKGVEERTKNFWNFKNKIPNSFYDATTGIEPVDNTIMKINNSAYGNHIERLMIMGNFMLLCEINPNDVYKWFMEMFIDAYDWVMVPNVYGMSQFADGGLMSTKPYISGSNYILKMSNYKKDSWCEIWDALFWGFIDNKRDFFKKNPRMRMMVSSYDRMNDEKKNKMKKISFDYLTELYAKN